MDTITETAEKVGRRARRAARSTAKDLAKSAKRARKDLPKNAKRARKDLAKTAKQARETAGGLVAAATGRPQRKRRRWPWLLGIAALTASAAGAAVVLRGKEAEQVAEQDTPATQARPGTNGATPYPKHEGHQADSPASRN